MDYVWIQPANLPAWDDLREAVAHGKSLGLASPTDEEMAAMSQADAAESVRAHYFPEITLDTYLMYCQLTDSVWPDEEFLEHNLFYKVAKAQTTFDDVQRAVASLDAIGGAPMKWDLIPEHMQKAVSLIVDLDRENSRAGSPEDVHFSMDEFHAQKTGYPALLVNMFRNSGLAVLGPFPHYCMAQVYLKNGNRLYKRVKQCLA